MKKFLFVCGGTGGHIFPAVAIAESLKKMGVEDIVFAGRKDSMEERLVSKNWPYEFITAVPLHRGPFLKNLTLPFNLSKSLVRAKSVIKKVKPDVVVATGGYVSLPIVLAAGSLGLPVYLQEQNAVAGIANKVQCFAASHLFEVYRHLQESSCLKHRVCSNRFCNTRNALHAEHVGICAFVNATAVAERLVHRLEEKTLARHLAVFHRQAEEP